MRAKHPRAEARHSFPVPFFTALKRLLRNCAVPNGTRGNLPLAPGLTPRATIVSPCGLALSLRSDVYVPPRVVLGESRNRLRSVMLPPKTE